MNRVLCTNVTSMPVVEAGSVTALCGLAQNFAQLAVARSLQHEPDGAVEHSPRALLDLRANGYLGGR